MEARTCAHCGSPFVAQRPNAKYCGSSCRGKASLARSAGTVVPLPVGVDRSAVGGVLDAVRKELVDVGRESSALGAMALELARTIDDPMTPPGAKANLTKQLGATMAEALRTQRRSGLADLRGARDRLRAV